MKIVIFGANGKTGSVLAGQALASGHQVTAYIRRAGSVPQSHPNLRIVNGELTDPVKLKEAIEGADACISTLGGTSLKEHSTQIVAGIDIIIKTMEQTGVKRFIYLSSLGVGESRKFLGLYRRFFAVGITYRIPMADHKANESRISTSNLNWTVIRPVSLTDGPHTGGIKYGSEKTRIKKSDTVSRANLAAFMLEQLTDTAYNKKAVWLKE
jgi:putative NADH-flavin reductase